MEQQNHVSLRGIVGNVKISEVSGTRFARMTVATTLAYRDKDGCCVLETTWHTVTGFEKNLPGVDFDALAKGCAVEVEGRLRNNRVASENGQEYAITEIIATRLQILEAKLTFQEK